MTKRQIGAPLPLDEADEIVRLKLDGLTVLVIAERVGVNKDTVTKVWRQWLDDTSPERRAELEQQRTILIGRMWRLADRCRDGAVTADTADLARKWAAEERQALRTVSTICGFDAPIRVQTSTFATPSEEDARAALAKL